jgi:hypothetical protein
MSTVLRLENPGLEEYLITLLETKMKNVSQEDLRMGPTGLPGL